jgi:hypothetical protein
MDNNYHKRVIDRATWWSWDSPLPIKTTVYCIPCDFCGETSHSSENCPHAVDLKDAHEYQMTR